MTGVRIHGYRDFQRGLRRLSVEASKELHAELKSVAKIVADDARGRVETGPPAGGHIRSSIRPYSTQRGAGVKLGGRRHPYGPWLVYGGRVGRNNSVVRARSRGRYLMPAYRANRRRVLAGMTTALARAVARSGL